MAGVPLGRAVRVSEVVTRRASAAVLHTDHGVPGPPAIVVCEVTEPALVIGSAQREDAVDHDSARAAGIGVVKRRSGGGAVLLVPGEHLWVDVVLPGARLGDGIESTFDSVGSAWRGALDDHGLGAEIHRGAVDRDAIATQVCFAGLGHGEVVVDGAKVVGLSQRRTRDAVRVQCLCLLVWNHEALVDLLSAPVDGLVDRLPAPGRLDVAPAALLDSVIQHLT